MAGVVLVVALIGGGVAAAGSSVTGTEIGDEESYYEVEVTLPDGRQVDVQFDEGFNVVGTEGDDDEDEGDGRHR